MDTGILAMARILVYLDTRDGLVESYRFQLGSTICWQELGYEGILFICRRCHEVGHLYKSFPLVTGLRPNPPRSFVAANTQTDMGMAEITTLQSRLTKGLDGQPLAPPESENWN